MRGPIAPASQRVLATALFELVHRRVPGPGHLGALTGLRPDAVEAALTELVRAGAIVRDSAGALVAVYPLSAVPTPHVVEVKSSAPWANCAIDGQYGARECMAASKDLAGTHRFGS